MELQVQGLYLLGNRRERALLKADGLNQYLGLNSLPGAGLRARGQALLRASGTCSEDGFVTSPVVREKWAGKQRGERKGCPARCGGLLGEIKMAWQCQRGGNPTGLQGQTTAVSKAGLLLIQLLPLFPPTSSSLSLLNHPRGMAGFSGHTKDLGSTSHTSAHTKPEEKSCPCALCTGLSHAESSVVDEKGTI